MLDLDQRELKRGAELIALKPKVFDLLVHLVQNRDRVVGRDDLLAMAWGGRIVSDSTLTSRIARYAGSGLGGGLLSAALHGRLERRS